MVNSQIFQKLSYSVRNNDVRSLKTLLADEVTPETLNHRDKDGWTLLHRASSKGHVKIIKILIEAGAKIDAAGNDDWQPLHLACSRGYADATQALIYAGAHVDVTAKRGYTPLHKASAHGHVEVVKLLIELGADVNAFNNCDSTPLNEASETGQIEVVKLLLDSGADTDPSDYFTPLFNAAFECHDDVVKLLIDAGAKVDVIDEDGGTVLHLAAARGHVEVARLLIEAGANINATDCEECTPLHRTAFRGHLDVAELLVEAGANIYAIDICGKTPEQEAIKTQESEVVEYLRRIRLAKHDSREAIPQVSDTSCKTAELQAEIARLKRRCEYLESSQRAELANRQATAELNRRLYALTEKLDNYMREVADLKLQLRERQETPQLSTVEKVTKLKFR